MVVYVGHGNNGTGKEMAPENISPRQNGTMQIGNKCHPKRNVIAY